MERVSLAFSICLSNGNPVEEFHLRRGVHQRDHLSSFLSIIDVEGLHILLKASSKVGLLKEYFFYISSRVIRLGRMMILSFSLRTYSLQIIR
jgi:hypothetical protein